MMMSFTKNLCAWNQDYQDLEPKSLLQLFQPRLHLLLPTLVDVLLPYHPHPNRKYQNKNVIRGNFHNLVMKS